MGTVREGGGGSRYVVKLDFEEVIGTELTTVFSREASRRVAVAQVIGEETGAREAASGFDMDGVLLPSNSSFDDADIDLRARHVEFEGQEASDVTLTAQLREGRLEDAPFAFVYDEEKFSGKARADFRGKVPEVELQLLADKVDVAGLLREVRLAEIPGFTTEELNLDMHLRGATAREMLRESNFLATFKKGAWMLRSGGKRGPVAVAVDDGTLEVKAGESLVFHVNGHVEEEALALRFESDGFDAVAEGRKRLKSRLEVILPGTKIGLDFDVALPLDPEDINGALSIDTKSLSDLDELFNLDLPPLSPFHLTSQFQVLSSGYAMKGIDLRVGGTRLSGRSM